MEVLKVYQITDRVIIQSNLTDEQKTNINLIFKKILGVDEKGKSGEIKKFIINKDIENHKLLKVKTILSDNKNDLDIVSKILDSFADELLHAELVNDGDSIRRNKNITQGTLFIKMKSNMIIFLKLDEIVIIDKETFAMSDSYSIDRKYYKAAIYSGDDVDVIDKNNKNVANYWAKRFLKIIPKRDDKQNTKVLADLVKSKDILNKNILDLSYGEEIYNAIQHYINNENIFDVNDLYEYISNRVQNIELSLYDIFNIDKLNLIDSSFHIDKNEINKAYEESLRVNKNISLKFDNIFNAYHRGEVLLEDNKLIIKVHDEYKNKITQLIDKIK